LFLASSFVTSPHGVTASRVASPHNTRHLSPRDDSEALGACLKVSLNPTEKQERFCEQSGPSRGQRFYLQAYEGGQYTVTRGCRGMGTKQIAEMLHLLVAGGWLEPENPSPPIAPGKSILCCTPPSPHPQPGLLEIHFVTPQRHCLADPQAVAIHHEHQQMVAHAMPCGLGSIEQRGDFGLRQEVLGPFVAVGGTGTVTFDISPLGRSPWHAANPLMIRSSG
jgi:hypothetical protein